MGRHPVYYFYSHRQDNICGFIMCRALFPQAALGIMQMVEDTLIEHAHTKPLLPSQLVRYREVQLPDSKLECLNFGNGLLWHNVVGDYRWVGVTWVIMYSFMVKISWDPLLFIEVWLKRSNSARKFSVGRPKR